MEVLSYEMTAVSLVQRAIAARAGVPSLSLEDAVRNQSADQAAIYDVAGQLSDLPINVTTPGQGHEQPGGVRETPAQVEAG